MGSNFGPGREQDGQDDWLEDVKTLLWSLAGTDIVELELEVGGSRIHVHRQAGLLPPLSVLPAPPAMSPNAESVGGASIATPITGVFYLTPAPDAPPFVEVGARVEVGQVVGLVEAMKVFNEITSEVAGTVVQILAAPGTIVEKGQALLVVQED